MSRWTPIYSDRQIGGCPIVCEHIYASFALVQHRASAQFIQKSVGSLDSIFASKCGVKMTLTFDADSGRGSLLMAASTLVQFAAAQRSEDGRKPGALYNEPMKDP